MDDEIIKRAKLFNSLALVETGIEGHVDMTRDGNESRIDSDCLKKRTHKNRNVITVSTTIHECLIRKLKKVDGFCTNVILKG